MGWVQGIWRLSDVLPAKVVALRMHRRKSDEAMNKLNVILYSLYINAASLITRWQVLLGIMSASIRISPPVPCREPFTPDVLHLSQGASSTCLPLATTKPSKLNLSQKTLKGHKSNISFAVYQPILPIIVIGDSPDHCLGTHTLLPAAPGMHDVVARLDGDVAVPQPSWGESRGRYALEHTHSTTTTRT